MTTVTSQANMSSQFNSLHPYVSVCLSVCMSVCVSACVHTTIPTATNHYRLIRWKAIMRHNLLSLGRNNLNSSDTQNSAAVVGSFNPRCMTQSL